jgi:hypothetical protein
MNTVLSVFNAASGGRSVGVVRLRNKGHSLFVFDAVQFE